MNLPLVVAGALALAGAGLHGAGGEAFVLRRLRADVLPRTAFGDAAATRMMIWVAWHMTTFAFLALGVALVVYGTRHEGNWGVEMLAAGLITGFAGLAVGAALRRGPGGLLRHPAPALLVLAAALAWWGLA